MANICYTNYMIVGDKEELDHLQLIVDKLWESNKTKKRLPGIKPVDNSWGGVFLGSLLNSLDFPPTNIYCPGAIAYYEEIDCADGEYFLRIDTESKWADLPEVWDLVMSKYKTLKYYFYAEEPGMGYYRKSDPTGKYFLDKYLVTQDAVEDEYIDSDEYLISSIKGRTGIDGISSVEEAFSAIETWNESCKNEDYQITCYEIEEV